MKFLSYAHRWPIPFMDEEGSGGGAGGEGGSGDQGSTDGGDNGANKPQSFADLLKANPDYQSELDRRVNQAVNTAISNERERQQIIKDGLQDEVLRVSKMTQEEKDAYFKAKTEKEAAEKEKSLTERELRLDARQALQEKGLPDSFIDLLSYQDKDACNKSIETLSAAFREAVNKAVDEKLKGGTPPKDAKTEGTKPTGTEAYDDALAVAAKVAGVQLNKK